MYKTREKKLKPSQNNVVLAEYRLLNALLNKDIFNDTRINENLFVDTVAKSVYQGIKALYDSNTPITPASLLQSCGNIDYNVNQGVIQTIFDIEHNEVTNIDDILVTLKDAELKSAVIDKLDNIKQTVSQAGLLDQNNVLSSLYDVSETVEDYKKSDSKLMSYSEWSDKYIEDLKLRAEGKFNSFGDPLLDKFFFRGAMGGKITIVASASSMGKSTFVLNLMDGLLEQNTPCLYLSLEMGTIDTFDRLISKKTGINAKDLYDKDTVDGVIAQVESEKKRLQNYKNFYFSEESGVDIARLQCIIKEFKQRTHQDYCLVAIDLLSSMRGFMAESNSMSSAQSIEVQLNKLETLAKTENVHIVGVVQIRRNNDSGHLTTLDDVEKFRPTINQIKNSSAYFEKAEQLLILFRKKYYIEKYFANDPTINMSSIPDILEVQVLKNRSGKTGTILKYMYESELFKVYPLADEEQNLDEGNQETVELNF